MTRRSPGAPSSASPAELDPSAALEAREISVTAERALELILDPARPLESEKVRLEDVAGRVASRDIRARRALPGWDNSSKDGYAVSRADLAPSSRGPGAPSLRVGEEVAAGAWPREGLTRGTAIPVMTGAPIPAGADAVVAVEDTIGPRGRGRFAAAGEQVSFARVPGQGENVRRAGADVAVGDVVVEGGTAIRPGRVALLAALGEVQVEAHRLPRVAVIPTGDELVEPGTDAPPGKLHSSNAHGVAAFAREAGALVHVEPIVPDDRLLIRSAVFRALEESDVIVTTGGVSAGAHDHVRSVLREAAGGLVFWKVRIRPGDPLVFGRSSGSAGAGGGPTRHFFGLPGNPTSAAVTFLEFARPLLRRLAGYADVFLPTVRARLAKDLRTEPGRRSFVRVRLERDAAGELVATAAGPQGSGFLRPLADADGLLVSGPDVTELPGGSRVTVQLLDTPPGSGRPFDSPGPPG